MDESETRAAIEAALLRECGERGYRRATIAAVLERSGADEAAFARNYGSLEDCYACAYASGTEGVVKELERRVVRAAGWREGLRSALLTLAERIESDPAFAAGLLVEAGVVGGEAMALRRGLIGRAVEALRSAAGDPEAGEVLGALDAELRVYTVEEAATTALACGEPGGFRAALPDLTYLILAGSYAEEIARAESRLVLAEARPG